jgi:nickel-dependent lactate racemase
MLDQRLIAPSGQRLKDDDIRTALSTLEKPFANLRILVLIPDHTRSLPLPFLFRALVASLHSAKQLDFMVSLGTHPPLSEARLNQLVGMTTAERHTLAAGRGFDGRNAGYPAIHLLNHLWDDPTALTSIGILEGDQIKALAGDHWHATLPERVDIRINKAILGYDHILIVGPTFPHEVVGFSGGAKYLFPGISGPEMINATHWLGALAGVVRTIGIKDTPVRAMIDAAAEKVPTPITLIALTVEDDALSGLFIGDHRSAWDAAADLSAQRHIHWCEKPFKRVLSCAPKMYDELWTAAKAMYKLEPAVAHGGEVVIFAPHLKTVSHVHGAFIHEIGYHILDYFLADWGRFKHIPLGVLAHATHLRGSGIMRDGVEQPHVQVTLASQISPEDCAHLNLGYQDPAEVTMAAWEGQEADGILVVPKAGEMLYRLK